MDFTLHNGVDMPGLGLGLFEVAPARTASVVRCALACGYRLFDTAALYENERGVGEALRNSGLSRRDIFVTTKVHNLDQGYDATLKAFDESLDALGLEYIDLYLIHFPLSETRLETWRALTKLYKEKRCRAIGVSNFMVHHLRELEEFSELLPTVNQVEFHPYLFNHELLSYCEERGIHLQAYSPLARGAQFDDPKLVELAGHYHRTPAQILLRWSLEHGCSVIPKSIRPSRIRENSQIFDFDLEADDVATMDSFSCDLRMCWDPTEIP